MIFRKAFFFIATIERLTRLLPKAIYAFIYFVLCSWFLYLIKFGSIDFSKSGFFYKPLESISYMISYVKHIIKFRSEVGFAYFFYLGASALLSYLTLNGLKNLIFITKKAFLSGESFRASVEARSSKIRRLRLAKASNKSPKRKEGVSAGVENAFESKNQIINDVNTGIKSNKNNQNNINE